MYRSFYHLSSDPFRLTPDPRFCFPNQSYTKARAYLRYALQQGEGIVIITGRSGTGKTTLIEGFLGELTPAETVTARFAADELKPTDLLRRVAYAFGLAVENLDKASLLHRVEQRLVDHQRSDQRVLLIVDEAQRLACPALEELRLLADLQSSTRPLLQMFLLGQERLREVLRAREMEQLQQRVIAACHLEAMNLQETRDYVEHRLRRAGWRGDPELSGRAVLAVYRHSQGLPRHINKICGRLLLHGATEERHRLDEKDVRAAVRELRDELLAPLCSDPDASVWWGTAPTDQVIGFGSLADLALIAPAPDAKPQIDVSRPSWGFAPAMDGHDGGRPVASASPLRAGARAEEARSSSAPASGAQYRYMPRHPPPRTLRHSVAVLMLSGYRDGAARVGAMWQWSGTRLIALMQTLGFRGAASSRKPDQQAGKCSNAPEPPALLRRLDGKRGPTGVRRSDPGSKVPMALGMLVVATLAAAAFKLGDDRAPDDSMPGLAAELNALDDAPDRYESSVMFPVPAGLPREVELLIESGWSPSLALPVSIDPRADTQRGVDSGATLARVTGQPASGADSVEGAAKSAELSLGTQNTLAGTALPPGNEFAANGVRGGTRQTPASADTAAFPIPGPVGVIAAPHGAAAAYSESETWTGSVQGKREPDPQAEELVNQAAEDSVLESVSVTTSNVTVVSQSSVGEAATEQQQAVAPAPDPLVSAVSNDEPEQAPIGQVTEMSASSQIDEIAEYLALAQQLLQRDRLLLPVHENAFRYYQRVLGLDAGNSAAEQGLNRIVARYVELAQHAISRHDYDAAQLFISRGLRVRPGHTNLLAMRQSVSAAAAAEQAEVVIEPDEPPFMTEVENQPEPQDLMDQLKQLFTSGRDAETDAN